MTSNSYKIHALQFPDDGNKVILEYIMVCLDRRNFITRTYVVDFEPKTPEECPERYVRKSDTCEEQYPAPEWTMKPAVMVKDPFRLGKHKIVLCEPEYADKRNKDVEFNSRKKLKEVMDQVEEHEVWFGIEQEFTITDKNDIPLDWTMYYPYIDLNSTLEKGDHVGFERQIVELHFRACLYAGLNMYGFVRESHPSQWEFQVGPLPGIQTADHVIFARYILIRLAEIHNVKISFSNLDCARNTNARQTLNLNFSTKDTRAEGGIKKIYEMIDNLSKYPYEEIYKHFDLSNGEEMKWHLDGDYYMPMYDTFKFTVGDKNKASVRIPTKVFDEGKGYIEERRPVANADPYDICRVFTIAALFGRQDFEQTS